MERFLFQYIPMKKLLLILLVFLSVFTAQAQKETVKVFNAENLNSIILNSDEVYRVVVKTAPVNSITIRSIADGEYFNDISLESEVNQSSLILRSRFREILQSGFDKLSAHKVFAMEVQLEIPEGIKLEIKSNVTSVFINGDYDEVLIQLKTGSAFLEDFTGNAVINTYEGNIDIQTQNARYEANSRHGKVILPDSGPGDHLIKLTSINGNIKVQETK